MIKQRKNMEHKNDEGQEELSEEMLAFLGREEIEARVQALIDGAREAGLTDYSRADAIRDLALLENNSNPHNNE